MAIVALTSLDPDLPVPSYARESDGGCDLVARTSATLTAGGGRATIPTGIIVAIPDGYAGLVVPRSGLAANHGITCLNAPGLIDAGYRGEIAVILANLDPTTTYEVTRGDRIAQLVIVAIERATFVLTDKNDLPSSERGTGGFGHSGR